MLLAVIVLVQAQNENIGGNILSRFFFSSPTKQPQQEDYYDKPKTPKPSKPGFFNMNKKPEPSKPPKKEYDYPIRPINILLNLPAVPAMATTQRYNPTMSIYTATPPPLTTYQSLPMTTYPPTPTTTPYYTTSNPSYPTPPPSYPTPPPSYPTQPFYTTSATPYYNGQPSNGAPSPLVPSMIGSNPPVNPGPLGNIALPPGPILPPGLNLPPGLLPSIQQPGIIPQSVLDAIPPLISPLRPALQSLSQ